MGDQSNDEYEHLLSKYLKFYIDLHERKRRPKTAAQRQFQDVAWGLSEPATVHERAYIYYLEKIGKTRQTTVSLLPRDLQASPFDVGKKWDAAAKNMDKWKPWSE